MKLKAFVTFDVYDGPYDLCLLVFAHTRSKAKSAVISYIADDYIDIGVRRVPEMDQYAKGDRRYIVWDNSELPDGITYYSDPGNYASWEFEGVGAGDG